MNSPSKKDWMMWFFAVCFFAFQFVLRIFPGLVVHDMMNQFKVDATTFGVLSGVYYIGYSGLQIPIGILLDRYRPGLVIALCGLTCSVGALLFALSSHWGTVVFARFLIGAGSAAGFLGVAKVVTESFPARNFTKMIALSFSLGLCGALYGGKPTSLLVDRFGWNAVLEILGIFCFVLSLVIFVFSPRAKTLSRTAEKSLPLAQSFREILNQPKLLWVGLAGALMVGPLEGFADVWGISYLSRVRGFSKHDASLITSFIYFGMLFGGPILSYFAEKFKSLYGVTAFCGFGMGSIFLFIFLYPGTFPRLAMILLMSAVGVLCCYQVIVFSIASKLVKPHLVGLATSITNCINMSAGFLIHYLMGLVMDLHWAGHMRDGAKHYTEQSYVGAVFIIPTMLYLGCLGILVLQTRMSKGAVHKPRG